jgi:hypothetical protein
VRDKERDACAALEARERHPSKSLDRLGLDEYRKKRMCVLAVDLYGAGKFLLQKAKEYAVVRR